jgi:hypothetical protein
MKQSSFSKMSDEALKKGISTATILSAMLGGTLIVLLGLTIYNYPQQGFSPLSIIPFALSPILFLNISNVMKMKAELKSRESK